LTQSPFIEFGANLALIPLPQDLPGFDTFISAWLVTGERTYLVDPGPAVTIQKLVAALRALDIHHLDAILLTHIHIDHSGGIGDLVTHFPDTPVVCHPKAVEHLVDPARLWAGSVKTLGATARAYGPISPVPADRVVSVEALSERDIDIIPTPGHAGHHVSYLINDTLFAGEAGGVYRELPDGFYLRPATPPKFYLETSLESITALEQVDCRRMCYGHFGLTRTPAKLLKAHRRQLTWWAATIMKLIGEAEIPDPVQACLEALIKEDPLLSGWPQLSRPAQQRELSFMANSVRGFLGYLQNSQS
jgi:glyoxylase-like metal-dependent hydrolase (beta-lactamase superfamily II)